MSLLSSITKKITKQKTEVVAKQNLKTWYKENYEKTIIQRNFLLSALFITSMIIAASLYVIKYVTNKQTIEPFVIEIEEKTGIPTVVNPITLHQYSSNQAIKQYFIMEYIDAREGYSKSTFMRNFNQVVRILSSNDVYYRGYRPSASPHNKDSIYRTKSEHYTRSVLLKSIIFRTNHSAQVRIRINDSDGRSEDKIIYMEFGFHDLTMSESERLINPLGFVVTLYKIADEKVSQ